MPKHKRVGNYELKETIGKGTFSKVKRAINTETGEVVAIKIININSLEKEGMEKQVKREILVLKNIKHKNVVQMIEVLKSVNHIYIVMELVYGGELFDKIVAAKRFDEDTARHYFHQLVEGIRYCHSQDVAHRDLKPENLLLVGDTLKISDFGLSGISRNNQMLNTICGTPHYVAPEVLSGSYDGKKADIWSLGIILFVMISGCHPFDGETVNELFKRIEALEFKYPPYFSKEVRGLLDKIIVVDPEARATIEDIITDPWFRVGYKPTGPITPVTSAAASGEENLESAFQETNEVEIEEKKRKASVINNSARGTDSYDQMNAFEIVTYLMKDKMNALIPNTTVKPTSCFIAEGGVDQLYNDIVKFFDLKKSTLKQKDNTFEFKAKIRNAKFGELEISVRILPLQKSLMICECYRIKGASLKYHDAVRTLTEQFASKHHKQATPVSSSPAKPSPFLEESPKPATTTESA